MIKFFIGLLSVIIVSVKIIGFAVVGYIGYYIYNYGLDHLLTSIWKGFA